jgi:hypothetical protein
MKHIFTLICILAADTATAATKSRVGATMGGPAEGGEYIMGEQPGYTRGFITSMPFETSCATPVTCTWSAPQVFSGNSMDIIDLHTSPPSNFTGYSGAGALFDVCNPTGCIAGPHILAKEVSMLTSTRDATTQEINAQFSAIFQTGKVAHWTKSTAFSANDLVLASNTGSFGSVYKVKTNCTSADTGMGPAGGPGTTGIIDGSCLLDYYTDGINPGKSNVSISTEVLPGSNYAWGLVNDFHVEKGVGNITAYATEFDCTNHQEDSYAGAAFGFNCFTFGGQSDSATYPMLAWMYFNSGNQDYGAHYGLIFNSHKVVKDAVIADGTTATYTLQALAGRTHAAFLEDDSNSSTVLLATGTHANGVDFTQAAITFYPFRSPNYSVDATGALAVSSVTSSGAVSAASIASASIVTANVMKPSRSLQVAAAVPTISSCGISPPKAAASSSNQGGQFTLGTGAVSTCTVTFANAFPNNAFCTVTPASSYAGSYYVDWTASDKTKFTLRLSVEADSVVFNYSCNGN